MQNFKSRIGSPCPLRLSDIILFPFFVFPSYAAIFLRILLHFSLRITPHNKIMEKKLREEITPKPVPDIFRHIVKLPYLTVTCELDLKHLLLRIVACRLYHRITPLYPSHSYNNLSFFSCFCQPWHTCPFAVRRFALSLSWKISPFILSREDFCPTHYDNRSLFYFPFVLPLCRSSILLNTCLYSHPHGVAWAVAVCAADMTLFSFIKCSRLKVSLVHS